MLEFLHQAADLLGCSPAISSGCRREDIQPKFLQTVKLFSFLIKIPQSVVLGFVFCIPLPVFPLFFCPMFFTRVSFSVLPSIVLACVPLPSCMNSPDKTSLQVSLCLIQGVFSMLSYPNQQGCTTSPCRPVQVSVLPPSQNLFLFPTPRVGPAPNSPQVTRDRFNS